MGNARDLGPGVRRLAALVFTDGGRLRLLAWGRGLSVFAGLRLPRRPDRGNAP